MSKDTKVYVKFEPVIVKGWAFGGQACDTDDIEVSVCSNPTKAVLFQGGV